MNDYWILPGIVLSGAVQAIFSSSKWPFLKQNLKVKTFVGTTENALRIQLWTALIALLFLSMENDFV